MKEDSNDQARRRLEREAEWDRTSFWIALTIALGPIPLCLLISWALGAPPWRGRPASGQEEAGKASAAPERPGPSGGHGHG